MNNHIMWQISINTRQATKRVLVHLLTQRASIYINGIEDLVIQEKSLTLCLADVRSWCGENASMGYHFLSVS